MPELSMREVLLDIIRNSLTTSSDGHLQQSTTLREAAQQLSISSHGSNRDAEQALLTEWYDLFRTGVLAWGFNLMNPDPPFFHPTERGRKILERVARDPSNPAAYLRHLTSVTRIGDVTKSYLVEGLNCYAAGFHKAAAVMVGAAAESVILDLRDVVTERLKSLNRPVPRELSDLQIRPVTKALAKVFDAIDRKTHRELRERFEMYWAGLSGQIRNVRNDAGHPTSIDPVTLDTVHASLLIFPELATLAEALSKWGAKEVM